MDDCSLYEGYGIFGHVPTKEEAEAKAFVMPREAQDGNFWPGYVSGLVDAGVPVEQAMPLICAFIRGQFAHNCEPSFYDELGEDE